eukprot:1486611-Rhodomonas_salina.1
MSRVSGACNGCPANTYKNSVSNTDQCKPCPAGAKSLASQPTCACTSSLFKMDLSVMVCRETSSGATFKSELKIIGLSVTVFSLITLGVLLVPPIAYMTIFKSAKTSPTVPSTSIMDKLRISPKNTKKMQA